MVTLSYDFVHIDSKARGTAHGLGKGKEVEGDRGAGARENRGREGYGRREKKGREAGSL